MDKITFQFENELKGKMLRAKKECRYNPTRFNQMLSQYGGVDTAKRLIASGIASGNPSDRYTTLYLCGRLDLTMEHSVCKPEYQSLFTSEEIDYCKQLLKKNNDVDSNRISRSPDLESEEIYDFPATGPRPEGCCGR